MRNCKLCRYSAVCNDLPGICILLPYIAVAVIAVALGYLFITQELALTDTPADAPVSPVTIQ